MSDTDIDVTKLVPIPKEFWETHTLTIDGHAQLTEEALKAESKRVMAYFNSVHSALDAITILGNAATCVFNRWTAPESDKARVAMRWCQNLIDILEEREPTP